MDTVVQKVQKKYDALKAKNEKLVQENDALRQQLKDLKHSKTRISRLPKKEAPPSQQQQLQQQQEENAPPVA